MSNKIAILGANGLAGNAIKNAISTNSVLTPSSKELNLRDKQATFNWFKWFKPNQVYFAAAKVGGIKANINQPVEFAIENLEMITNTFQAAYEYNVDKLLFLSSSCISG